MCEGVKFRVCDHSVMTTAGGSGGCSERIASLTIPHLQNTAIIRHSHGQSLQNLVYSHFPKILLTSADLKNWSCRKVNLAKNWLLNPGTSSQSEGYSSKWLIWLVCREPPIILMEILISIIIIIMLWLSNSIYVIMHVIYYYRIKQFSVCSNNTGTLSEGLRAIIIT